MFTCVLRFIKGLSFVSCFMNLIMFWLTCLKIIMYNKSIKSISIPNWLFNYIPTIDKFSFSIFKEMCFFVSSSYSIWTLFWTKILAEFERIFNKKKLNVLGFSLLSLLLLSASTMKHQAFLSYILNASYTWDN